jgi:hypothetical protein
MRTVYFWYTIWPAADQALRQHAPGWTATWTGPDTGGYWREFSRRWDGSDDLLCVEQDVVIHDQVIPQLLACPQPWCTFGWVSSNGNASTRWLGCTRFSAQLQRELPLDQLRCPAIHPPSERCKGIFCDIGTRIPVGSCYSRHHECNDCGSWCHAHMDSIFPAIMMHLGTSSPHIHTPPVRHLHYEGRP